MPKVIPRDHNFPHSRDNKNNTNNTYIKTTRPVEGRGVWGAAP